MSPLLLEIPLAKPLPSLANARLHWATKARVVKKQRGTVKLHLWAQGGRWLRSLGLVREASLSMPRLECTLVRVAPRVLDSDNLQAAFKGARDEVALWCGLDDGSSHWTWRYEQERGAPAIRIELRVVESVAAMRGAS